MSSRVRVAAIAYIPAKATRSSIAAIAASTTLRAALGRTPARPSARQAHTEYGITTVGEVATPGVYPPKSSAERQMAEAVQSESRQGTLKESGASPRASSGDGSSGDQGAYERNADMDFGIGNPRAKPP